MTIKEKSLIELLEEAHQTMTDRAVGVVFDVTGHTIYRWRHGRTAIPRAKTVRLVLEHILSRPKN